MFDNFLGMKLTPNLYLYIWKPTGTYILEVKKIGKPTKQVIIY